MNSDSADFEYDVALSFAGEDREYVEKVAEALKERQIRVFYDRYEQARLWGKDLYEHLADVYRKKSRYCVMFLSKHYAAKLWTTHERRSAQARAFEENREYILPVRVDDTEVAGILPTIGYVWTKDFIPSALADLIVEKLREHQRPVSTTAQVPVGRVRVAPSTVRLASSLMSLLSERGGFSWKPRRGDLVWCPAICGDKAVLVYSRSPSNKEWFEYGPGKTHRMDDPDLRFIPRFMQIWTWLDRSTALNLHLWKIGSGPEAFQASAGSPMGMKKGYSSSLDAVLALMIDLIQSYRVQAEDIVRAAESVEHDVTHCVALAAKLTAAGVLPWTPSPGDLVVAPNRKPLRIFGGLSTAGTIQIEPGEEESIDGKVWIPDPEQVLDHFEDFLRGAGYDGFFLGPADFYGEIVCSIQGSRQGSSNANDPSYSGKDPQHTVLKMLAGFHRLR